MSAPGNSAILLVLLSVFVGCAGYALGRWHERRESGVEREEAYQDGYDHAARSVFSLAARVAGPRRRGAVRASATVRDQNEDPRSDDSRTGESSPAVASPPPLPASAPVSRSPMLPPPVPPLGFPAPAPHLVPGLPVPAADGGVRYSSLPDPHWSSRPDQVVPASPAAAPVPGSAPAPITPAPPVPAPVPGSAPFVPLSSHLGAAAGSVPMPVPVPRGPEAPRGREVPRGSEALLGPEVAQGPEAPRGPEVPRARHYAEPESSPDVPVEEDRSGRSGRHTVPEELVRAATYKLAADRVARAKVQSPEDPSSGPPPHVPRPRRL